MLYFKSDLEKCLNINDFRVLAKKKLPVMIFDYLDGGSDDEVTLRKNCQAFDKIELLPKVLRDVTNIDLSTSIMGEKIAFPFIMAPTGFTRLFHYQGEKAVARAASKANTFYSLSTVSNTSLEEVAKTANGPKCFQIYVWRDRELVKDMIKRCKKSDYQSLCLTVDLAIPGNRERDIRHGMSLPPKLSPGSALEMLLHPQWLYRFFTSPPLSMGNVPLGMTDSIKGDKNIQEYLASQLDPSVTWKDAKWMIEEWGNKPFLIKGIMNPEDAKKAVEIGASGIVISNHGGRQLDHVLAPIEILPEIVKAIKGKAEIIIDSGFRRGTDIIKALALGADAVMLGRSYIYALAAAGEKGVERMISLLENELKKDMALLGCTKISDLNSEYIR